MPWRQTCGQRPQKSSVSINPTRNNSHPHNIKPIRLLSLDSSDVSLPPANRDALSRQIDSVLAPDAVKKRLRMEAGIEDVDFIEIINVAQEEN